MSDTPGWVSPGGGTPPREDPGPGGPGWGQDQPAPPGWGSSQPGWGDPPPSGWGFPGAPPGAPPDAPPGWGPPPGAPPPGAPPGWGGPQGWGPPPGWGAHRPPDVKPGIIPLRPLGLGEILDGAVAIVRTHPLVTLGLAAAVAVVTNVLQLALIAGLLQDISGLSPEAIEAGNIDFVEVLGELAVVGLVAWVITEIAQLIFTGMLTDVVGKSVLGRPVALGETWDTVRPQLLRLVGVSAMTYVILAGVFLGPLVPGVLLAAVGAPGALVALALVVGGIAAVCLLVYAYIALALAPPALVLERQPVFAALRRSRVLVKGDWWRIFGILLLATVLASIVANIVALPFGLLGSGNPLSNFGSEPADITMTGLALNSIGAALGQTLVLPFAAGVTALLYVDRRMRAEGLDVSLRETARTGGDAVGHAPGGGF